MNKDLEEKLSLYKDSIYNEWCRITNNKNTIEKYEEYIKYLRESLNTSLRILVGNDKIQKSLSKFNYALEEIINLKGNKFHDGVLNAIKVIEGDNPDDYIIVADYIDDNVEAALVC